jgi:hypothetical protein
MMETETKTFYKCSICWREYNRKEEALACEKRHNKEKAFDNTKEFELKQYHLDLLKETYIDWDDCEYGAPAIDCKRPYGNSDVEDDIADIIKMPKKDNWDKNEEMWNDEAQEKLQDIHKETQIALQIILHCQSFKLGKYRKKEDYGQEWEFVK